MTANAGTGPFSNPRTEELAAALRAAAGDCRRRPELRAELDADPRAFLAERGMEIPPGPELKVAANTAAVFHLVMPADPNDILSDEALARISGGTTLRREASTLSSLSSLPSTVSSASTVREHYN